MQGSGTCGGHASCGQVLLHVHAHMLQAVQAVLPVDEAFLLCGPQQMLPQRVHCEGGPSKEHILHRCPREEQIQPHPWRDRHATPLPTATPHAAPCPAFLPTFAAAGCVPSMHAYFPCPLHL
eukprot:1139424-Pelagomonas_calceolata.AAC.3